MSKMNTRKYMWKPGLVLICMGVLSLSLKAQNVLELEWAKRMGGTEQDQSYSIALDSDGNVYTTGYFEGTMDFDPSDETFELTSTGAEDVFVSKLDSEGNFVWARSFGSEQADLSYTIEVDNEANVYISGSFQETVDFDPGDEIAALTAFGVDAFILKLDTDGNYLWARNMGGADSQNIGNIGVLKSLAADEDQNIYLAGSFTGTVDFNPTGGGEIHTADGGFDFYVLKLDINGAFLWINVIGGEGSDECNFIAIDEDNIYITGSFNGTVDFDAGAEEHNLTAGGMDIFVAKYDSDGNYIWARNIGGGGVNVSLSIAVNQESTNGNVYFTGYFLGATDFDPGAGVTTLTAVGSIDVFVCKFSQDGDFVWARNFGSTGADLGTYLVANANEEIFLTGRYENTIFFDPDTGLGNLESAGGTDAFIIVMNAQGGTMMARTVGGPGSDFGSSIATDSEGTIYTTGVFSSTADFDIGIGEFTLTSAGEGDVFVHKLVEGCVLDVNVVVSGTTITASFADAASFQWVDCNDNNAAIEGETNQFFTATETGSYAVVVSDGECSLMSACTDLTIDNCNLDASVTVAGATITASFADADSYQWVDCNDGNAEIEGATDQSFTAIESGSYAVLVSEGACSEMSTCTSVTIVSTSHVEREGNTSVYPNPTQDFFSVHTDNPFQNGSARIFNMSGQLISASSEINGDRIKFDITDFAPGIYFLEITEGSVVSRLKVVKY